MAGYGVGSAHYRSCWHGIKILRHITAEKVCGDLWWLTPAAWGLVVVRTCMYPSPPPEA